MKDEIKEIANRYKLFNYITNLQEENERLSRTITNYDELLMQRNNIIDKAIHRIQLLQMDGEVSIKDLGFIVKDLKGKNK